MNANKMTASESTINKGLQKGVKNCPFEMANQTLHLSGQRDLWNAHHLNAYAMSKKEKQKKQEIIRIKSKLLELEMINPSWKGILILVIVLAFIALMVK